MDVENNLNFLHGILQTRKAKILLTTGYLGVILVSSIIPMDRDIDREIKGLQFIIEINPTYQNLLHIPAFAIVSILFLQILEEYKVEGWEKYAVALLCCGGFGTLNEIIQFAVPGRYAGITDIGLNIIGSLVGVFIYISIEKIKLVLIR